MIPHVVFLLRDGLKAYLGWINDVLRSKHVPKLCKKNMSCFEKTHKRGHIFFAAGAFSQKNVHEIMKILEFLEKT